MRKNGLRRLLRQVRRVPADLERQAFSRGILSRKLLHLPGFLCIGAQKAGTAWLYENLRCHPEVYLHERKEIHYWDRRIHRSVRFYCRYFRDARGRVTGDITPSYSLLGTERVRAIQALAPDLKLLVLL